MRSCVGLLVVCVLVVALIVRGGRGHQHTQADKKNLSDKEHYTDGEGEGEGEEEREHNEEYDHEAFLGKEEAESFDELPPEESKARLAIIYDKIDTDGNGKVTSDELTAWIRDVHQRYQQRDTQRSWDELITDSQTEMSWESYAQKIYGRTEVPEEEESSDTGAGSEEEGEEYHKRRQMRRDRRRWERADQSGNGLLTMEEFNDFLHPEDVERMRESVVDETLDHMDRDKDDHISLEEYFADMQLDMAEGSPEADWMKEEKEEFRTTKDRNHDGKLDRQEIVEWIIPSDYDQSSAESGHLIQHSDDNKDGELSKEEVLNNYSLFVGSQATQYGEDLKQHEEL